MAGRLVYVDQEALRGFSFWWHLLTYVLAAIIVSLSYLTIGYELVATESGERLFISLWMGWFITLPFHFIFFTLIGYFSKKKGFFGLLPITGISVVTILPIVFVFGGGEIDLGDILRFSLIFYVPFGVVYWGLAVLLRPKAFPRKSTASSEQSEKIQIPSWAKVLLFTAIMAVLLLILRPTVSVYNPPPDDCVGWTTDDDFVARRYWSAVTIETTENCVVTESIDQTNAAYKTPLHMALSARADPAVVKLLIQAGAEVNLPDAIGKTPLMYAVMRYDDVSVVNSLLDAGADVNATDDGGETSLHLAVDQTKDTSVIAALLDAGADVNAKGRFGWAPLHLAVLLSEDASVIAALLDAGADVNAIDERGETPLHLAASTSDHPEFIILLLDAGANAKAVSNKGKSVLDEAKENKRLKNYGCLQTFV